MILASSHLILRCPCMHLQTRFGYLCLTMTFSCSLIQTSMGILLSLSYKSLRSPSILYIPFFELGAPINCSMRALAPQPIISCGNTINYTATVYLFFHGAIIHVLGTSEVCIPTPSNSSQDLSFSL